MTWRRQAIAHGRNGLILEVNFAAATMLDMAQGALVSMSIHQLILNEDRGILPAPLQYLKGNENANTIRISRIN